MRKMLFIESPSTNPAFNLALEQYVFDSMPRDQEYFMLWQNAHTIVVGKHQNTLAEINPAYVKEQGIQVVRRLSGGGAVYHDLGNVNFTFIADAGNIESLNLQAFCGPVIHTLQKLGIQAKLHGRNDITIDGRKFSGNSQYIRNGRIMHHGTLLFDSNLSVVSAALNVSPDKIESKGIKSVRSRVTNIRPHLPSDIGLDEFKSVLKKNMAQGSNMEEYHLSETDHSAVNQIKQERYDTWEWTYGSSPKYQIKKTRRVDGCGTIQLSMDITDGVITNFDSHGDYFGDGVTDALRGQLVGCLCKEKELTQALQKINLDSCYKNLSVPDFVSIILF